MITSVGAGVHQQQLDDADFPSPGSPADPLRAAFDGAWRIVRDTHPASNLRTATRELLAVGPPGLVAICAREVPGADVWVSSRAVTIDGQHSVVLRNARTFAERTSLRLSAATSHNVPVVSVVLLSGTASFNVKQLPREVHVTTDRRLRGWLSSLPVRLEADQIEALASIA